MRIIFIVFLLFSVTTFAEQKYNPYTKQYENVPKGSQLKYNYIERSWNFAPPRSELKYDSLNKKYQMVPKEYKSKYNYMEKKWEMSHPKSKLQYNPYNDKYEFSPYQSEIDPYKSDMD